MFEEKNLEELSEEQLGLLFPIKIIPFNKKWSVLFSKEKKLITETLGAKIVLRIEHFGSTAITGLAAKPTIDILIEIPPLTDELKTNIVRAMEKIGYRFIWRTDDPVPYMNFVKGYTLKGFKRNTFHIHMADKSHSLWDRIYFRDYLRVNTNVAREYEKLKIELAEKYKFNREAYTKAKADFVKRITEIAKNQIGCC